MKLRHLVVSSGLALAAAAFAYTPAFAADAVAAASGSSVSASSVSPSNPAPSKNILPNESMLWYYRNLAVIGVVAFFLLLGSLHLFGRLEDNIAEEI